MGRKSEIYFVGSGSSGNCTLLYDERGRCVVLDCGVGKSELMRSMEYDISCIDFVCVTHIHSDHSRLIPDLVDLGISVYGNDEVVKMFDGVTPMPKMLKYNGWKVQTFEVPHNAKCNAFIVDTFDSCRVLYCTDCRYIPFFVRRVNHAIVEANYDGDIIIDAKMNGLPVHKGSFNHQDIHSCIDYVKEIYSEDLQSVTMFHLSDGFSNESDFLSSMKNAIGIPGIYAAKRGLSIRLTKTEF